MRGPLLSAAHNPAPGAGFIHNIYLEVGFLLAAVAVGAYALSHGYSKHGFRAPAHAFGPGIGFIVIGNWVLTGRQPLGGTSPRDHSPLSVLLVAAGGLCIISAHTANYFLERRSIQMRKSA